MNKLYAAAPVLSAMLLWHPACLEAAQKGKPKVSVDQRVTRSAKAKAGRKAAEAAPNVITEVLGKGFTIEAGGSMTFDAVSDFIGAEKASIAVKAVAGSDIANQNFHIWVYWAMPDTDFWVANDAIIGDTFNFYIQGGGVVPVYGPELRLVLQNFGATPVTFDQLTVYAVRNIAAVATPATAAP